MSATLSKQVPTPNISNDDFLRKAEVLFASNFSANKESGTPDHIKLKLELKKVGFNKAVHVEVYANDNVEIKASPNIQPPFGIICDEIENILKESINITSKNSEKSFRVDRAQRLLDYVRDLSLTNEVNRLVAATLCDIILDLIVTEKLSTFTRSRDELENESVGAKLSCLEGKYKCVLYKPKIIRDTRDLRNKIAHGASPIREDEATNVIASTREIFALF
jgi:hypothetical protein